MDPHILQVHIIPVALARPEKTAEAIPPVTGQDVPMHVRYRLAHAVIEGDKSAISLQAKLHCLS